MSQERKLWWGTYQVGTGEGGYVNKIQKSRDINSIQYPKNSFYVLGLMPGNSGWRRKVEREGTLFLVGKEGTHWLGIVNAAIAESWFGRKVKRKEGREKRP